MHLIYLSCVCRHVDIRQQWFTAISWHSDCMSDCMASLATEQPLWLMSSLHCYRLQTNRSPVESPPTAKKFLRSSCSHQQPQQHRSSVASDNIDDTACKENRSILKRVDCSRSKSWHAGQTPRRVNFHQNVAVVAYDRSDGEHVCYESHRLNTEPRDRREFVSRTLLARVHSSKSTSSSFDGDSTSRQHYAPLTLTAGGGRSVDTGRQSSAGARPLPSVLAAVDNSLPSPVSIDFTFHEDRCGQLWLRFTVPLGRGVAAGDALVKANVAGNKVRVLGTRTIVRDATKPTRQEFATRYALPMDVDPYAISARMDSAGHLFVEAPVITGEGRHRTTSATADCTTI